MKNVYLVSEADFIPNDNPPFSSHDWTEEIKKIKSSNADIILIISDMELEAAYFMYSPLITKLETWLKANNKKIDFILPGILNYKSPVVNLHHIPNFIYFMIKSYNELRVKRDLMNRSNVYYTDGENITKIQKLYTCYINNPKYERARLLDQLTKVDLVKDGIVTFLFPKNVYDPYKENSYIWEYHNGSRLFDEFDYKLNGKQEYMATELPKSFYRGFLDIVCESEYKDDNFFLTEKTLKSLATLKPFITLASRNHNKEFLVKKYGFKLYDEYFDYSWDDKPLTDRVQGIVNNIHRLKTDINRSKFTLQDLYQELLPKLIYNQYRVLEIYYDTNYLPELFKNGIDDWNFINNQEWFNKSIFIGYVKWVTKKRNIL